MKFHYDKNIDAVAIRFSDHPYAESDEVGDGIIFDYDKDGRIIAIEILQASKVLPKQFEYATGNMSVPFIVEQSK